MQATKKHSPFMVFLGYLLTARDKSVAAHNQVRNAAATQANKTAQRRAWSFLGAAFAGFIAAAAFPPIIIVFAGFFLVSSLVMRGILKWLRHPGA